MKTRAPDFDVPVPDSQFRNVQGFWVDENWAWILTRPASQLQAIPINIQTGRRDLSAAVNLDSLGNPNGLTFADGRWFHPISFPNAFGDGRTLTRLYSSGGFYDLPTHPGIPVTPRGCGTVGDYVVISAYVFNFSTRVATFELFFFDTTTNLFETTRPWSLSPTNSSGVDVTGDDGVLWVYDQTDNKMYAYNADTGVALT